MNSLLSKIWFPAAVVAFAAATTVEYGPASEPSARLLGVPMEEIVDSPDTVVYRHDGYRAGWTAEDFKMDVKDFKDSITISFGDSLAMMSDTSAVKDSVHVLTARDTIAVPDSLRLTDPFRYKYYVALVDSPTHLLVRDSLKAAGDSIDWPKLDSLYALDSIALVKAKFDEWYAGLDKNGRKKYEMEQKARRKLDAMNRATARKDSIAEVKDSILKNTPRILETFALPDSLHYKRIVKWTHEREFHRINVSEQDTSFNYRFNDYPFMRKDVNATWLGVSGSPVQYYNYFNRKSDEKVSFYEAQESWSYSAATMPMYNTKTPYTELSYTGTLFAGTEKESDNLHLLTTQNITPAFNFLLEFDRFGGGGMLQEENTANKTSVLGANYLGKNYLAHAGIISNNVSRQENGGISNNFWIRDTTVNAREITTTLKDATSRIRKNTVFLDQQYRIPFTFINTMRENKTDKLIAQAYTDSVKARGNEVDPEKLALYVSDRRKSREAADTLSDDNITTAFIGHSSEFSVYRRTYKDKISSSDRKGDSFYNGAYFINPKATNDSMRVSRLDNKAFIRLQPWSEDGIVSRINAGVGDRLLTWYSFDPTFTKKNSNVSWNSAYVFAGAEGKLRNYIDWYAKGEFVFAGYEAADLDIDANMRFTIYPFRKARTSPVSLNLKFDTSLDEPEFYQQHMMSNHFKWDNEFGKISTTRIQAAIDIPHWKIKASAGYALLANNIYYDTFGIARQNDTPMSVLSANLDKEFVIGDILHLDNRALFQLSSNEEVIPLPTLAVNLKYYVQFNINNGAMYMQIGANALYNTAWYSPAWNPALGVFMNQTDEKYNNGPIFDAFVNMQWKRATIFIKYLNAGQGWPMDRSDYFTAHHYIYSQSAVKLGIYWPFYTQPAKAAGAHQ